MDVALLIASPSRTWKDRSVIDNDSSRLSQCVRSGFCCRRAPCPYGMWDDVLKQCVHLEQHEEIAPGTWTMACAKYEEILADPGSEFSPAFGAGCSSSLFNEDRDRIIRAQQVSLSKRNEEDSSE